MLNPEEGFQRYARLPEYKKIKKEGNGYMRL